MKKAIVITLIMTLFCSLSCSRDNEPVVEEELSLKEQIVGKWFYMYSEEEGQVVLLPNSECRDFIVFEEDGKATSQSYDWDTCKEDAPQILSYHVKENTLTIGYNNDTKSYKIKIEGDKLNIIIDESRNSIAYYER